MITVGQGKSEIPIRSLWFLLIYASDMLHELTAREHEALLAGDHDADLIDAIAEVLLSEVNRRLRQQLSNQYRSHAADLTRVRGTINHLRNETSRLLEQGRIACTYSDLTADSPRNRFIAATVRNLSRTVESEELRQRCATAAFTMQRLGVSAYAPSRAELSQDRLARHDAHDRRMLDAAHLAHEMAIPFHELGRRSVPRLIRDEHRYRMLFQRAIYGYFTHKFTPRGWTVYRPHLEWNGDKDHLLPRMETDVVLVDPSTKRRIIVEVKFTDALVDNRSGKTTINSNYLYQLFAYMTSDSQGRLDSDTEGVLLFVAANGRPPVNETTEIHGHRIRFLSVDLESTPRDIRRRWDICLEPEANSTK